MKEPSHSATGTSRSIRRVVDGHSASPRISLANGIFSLCWLYILSVRTCRTLLICTLSIDRLNGRKYVPSTNTTTVKPMSRIPASLLYLTVYNPTLRPTGPIPDGDEDAEEQAQILFYTSKERAVSRDRMLRQVGLAKALVNFTECVCRDGAWMGKV